MEFSTAHVWKVDFHIWCPHMQFSKKNLPSSVAFRPVIALESYRAALISVLLFTSIFGINDNSEFLDP